MSKLIGFRVPNESDLPDRLRAISFKLRLQHGELLERWITAEEAGAIPDGLRERDRAEPAASMSAAENISPDKLRDVEALLRRVSALEEKLSEIEARPITAEHIAAPPKKAPFLRVERRARPRRKKQRRLYQPRADPRRPTKRPTAELFRPKPRFWHE